MRQWADAEDGAASSNTIGIANGHVTAADLLLQKQHNAFLRAAGQEDWEESRRGQPDEWNAALDVGKVGFCFHVRVFWSYPYYPLFAFIQLKKVKSTASYNQKTFGSSRSNPFQRVSDEKKKGDKRKR